MTEYSVDTLTAGDLDPDGAIRLPSTLGGSYVRGQTRFVPAPRALKRIVIASLVSLSTTACDEPASPVELEGSVPTLSLQAARGPAVTRDDRFSDLVDEVPGFAGVFLENGDWVVMVKGEASNRDQVKAGLVPLLTRRTSDPDRIAEANSEADRMVLRNATFDFRELQTWRRALREPVFADELAHSLSIDERNNRIAIGTDDARKASRLMQAMEELGFPPQRSTW